MNIVSATFTAAPGIAEVFLGNGVVCFVDTSLPPDEQFRRMLTEWLSEGNSITPYVAPEAPPPSSVTKRQLKLWLVYNGYSIDAVEAIINGLPEPQRTIALIEWQDASEYRLDHPTFLMVAQALSIPDIVQAAREAAVL